MIINVKKLNCMPSEKSFSLSCLTADNSKGKTRSENCKKTIYYASPNAFWTNFYFILSSLFNSIKLATLLGLCTRSFVFTHWLARQLVQFGGNMIIYPFWLLLKSICEWGLGNLVANCEIISLDRILFYLLSPESMQPNCNAYCQLIRVIGVFSNTSSWATLHCNAVGDGNVKIRWLAQGQQLWQIILSQIFAVSRALESRK